MSSFPRTAALAAAMFAALAVAAPAGAATLTPRQCEAGVADGSRCSTLTVPLDRSGAVPGTLALPVRVLPARAGAPKRGPLIMLAGGPGQAGIADAGTNELFAELAPGYDIVSFDQRGTGATALRCAALAGEDPTDPADLDEPAGQTTSAFAHCAAQLGPGRDFFTSADSAADIDELRAALGAARITIGGTSYGTWVSQVYARMFPARVKRLILDSVVGPGGVAGIALSEYAGARRVIRQQCAGGACRGIARRPLARTERLVERLDSRPIRGRVVAESGKPRRAAVGGPDEPGVVNSLLYAGDLDPELRSTFPAVVSAALRGDPALLLRLAAMGGDEDEEDPAEMSSALYAATTCAESELPWAGSEDVELRRARLGAALAATPERLLAPWGTHGARTGPAIAGCLRWPGSPFAAPPAGPLPDAPALVLNGLDDVRTPVEDARAVAAQLPRATLVRIPNQGHSVFGQACAQRALKRFLTGRGVGGRICARTEGRDLLPLPPRSLAAVGPKGSGPRARARRSLRAARLAVHDAIDFLPIYDAPRFPGLRGGTAATRERVDESIMILRRYEYAPGLRVSGRLSFSDTVRGKLRVGGPRASRGLLLVRGGEIRGRLGGQPVSVPFR